MGAPTVDPDGPPRPLLDLDEALHVSRRKARHEGRDWDVADVRQVIRWYDNPSGAVAHAATGMRIAMAEAARDIETIRSRVRSGTELHRRLGHVLVRLHWVPTAEELIIGRPQNGGQRAPSDTRP